MGIESFNISFSSSTRRRNVFLKLNRMIASSSWICTQYFIRSRVNLPDKKGHSCSSSSALFSCWLLSSPARMESIACANVR